MILAYPLRRKYHGRVFAARGDAVSIEAWNFRSCNCIAVGQKPNMRHLVREMLHGVNLASLEFVTAIPDALPALSAMPCDLILLEVIEPVSAAVSFVELVRKAKKPINGTMPIIVSHGQLEEGSAELLRDAGVTELLPMPVSRKTLLEAMTTSLKNPRQFIAVPTYRGPDRRRGQSSDYKGPKRREVDALAEQLAERRALAEQHAKASRSADVELIAFLCDTTVAEAEERMTKDKGFSSFLCEGSQEEAHFTEVVNLSSIDPEEETGEEETPPEELPEELPEEVMEEEEKAMSQAELVARLNKTPHGKP